MLQPIVLVHFVQFGIQVLFQYIIYVDIGPLQLMIRLPLNFWHTTGQIEQ